jgi:hypothetical protein
MLDAAQAPCPEPPLRVWLVTDYGRSSSQIRRLTDGYGLEPAVQPCLDLWEGVVYNALVIAIGIGVWRSVQGSRVARVDWGRRRGVRQRLRPYSLLSLAAVVT